MVQCCGESGTPTELPAHYDIHYPDTVTKYHVNVSMIKGCDLPLLKRSDKVIAVAAVIIADVATAAAAARLKRGQCR